MNLERNTGVAQGSARNRLLEKFLLAFVAVAVLIAMLTPEDAYTRHESLRVLVDWVVLHFNVIGEFAAVSRFPGATRVVLALVWILVLPAALLIWLHPRVILWREESLLRHGILGRLVWLAFVAALVWIIPNAITFDGSPRAAAFMGLAGMSRVVLGIMSGTYCALAAFMLACVPRLVDPRFYFDRRDSRRG